MKKVAIIDYEMGNLASIFQGIRKIGGEPIITNNYDEIIECKYCILPGVGAFKKAINKIKELSLGKAIADFVETGKPLLGICLGMQLLVDYSEEFGFSKGLGIIPGHVEKIPDTSGLNVPHIGWNNIFKPDGSGNYWKHKLFREVPENSEFYFLHSFAVKVKNKANELSLTEYGNYTFCSAIFNRNIVGCQFHPEKSGPLGLAIMKDFISLS